MRKVSVLLGMLLGGGACCLAAAQQPAPGVIYSRYPGQPASQAQQDGVPGIIYSRYRHFRIPFFPTAGQRIKQLQLYVSTDQGRSWQPHALAPPEDKHFRFMTDRDGFFWFTVQTQDQDGKLYPPTLAGAQPSLKVIVDTVPPLVSLQPLPVRGGEIGVAWDIRDDNLDLSLPDAIQLDARQPGGAWLTLPRHPTQAQLYWNPMTANPVQVRLRARDRAGNWGEATTTLSLGGATADSGGVPATPSAEAFHGPIPPERKFVNSRRISLNYEVKEVGPSGVSAVELWYTQDGRSWNRYPPRPDDASQKAISFEVNGEGIYGISLVARSGVGLGIRPPQLGDRPQIWIEVDMTRPLVQLHDVSVGQGTDKGKLTVTWTARDKNLHPQPITLSYAEQTTGPWAALAENQANTGRYVWNMPQRVPYQFYVRVEAKDLAGNVGTALTPQLIKVDLSQPRVNILNVEPIAK